MEVSSHSSASAGGASASEEASGENDVGGNSVSEEGAAADVVSVAVHDAVVSPGAISAAPADAGATLFPSHEAVGQPESQATAEVFGGELAFEVAEVVPAEPGQDISAAALGVLEEPQLAMSEPVEASTNGNAKGDGEEEEEATVRNISSHAGELQTRDPECEINVIATESLSQTPCSAAEKADSRPADVCEVDTAVGGSAAAADPVDEVEAEDPHAVKAPAAASAEALQAKAADQATTVISKEVEATDEQAGPAVVEVAAASVTDQGEVERESVGSSSISIERAVAEDVASSTIEDGSSGNAQAAKGTEAAAPQLMRAADARGGPDEAKASPEPIAAKTSQMFIEKLRHPSAAASVSKVRDFVGAFPANLTRPQASRRIHEFITSTAPELLAADVFKDEADEAQPHWVMEGLEKFVVLKLYKLLFRHSATDVREDERVDRHIHERSQRFLSEDHGICEGDGVSKALEGMSPEQLTDFNTAAQELKKVDQFRSPRDKAVCMVNAFRFVEGVADALGLGSAATDAAARNLLPALVVRAAPPNVFSNVEFTVSYRHPSLLSEEERRCLRGLQSALVEVARAPGAVSPALPNGDCREAGGAAGDLPDWLVHAGVTLRFEESSAGELLVAEVDELLEEYHRMARALRELSGIGRFVPAVR